MTQPKEKFLQEVGNCKNRHLLVVSSLSLAESKHRLEKCGWEILKGGYDMVVINIGGGSDRAVFYRLFRDD